MNLEQLLSKATNKESFLSIDDYANFCKEYLDYIMHNQEAKIVSQNENNYIFYQYKKEGTYNITRPINRDLMIPLESFTKVNREFNYILKNIHDNGIDSLENRAIINQHIYTCQQSIGAGYCQGNVGKSRKERLRS